MGCAEKKMAGLAATSVMLGFAAGLFRNPLTGEGCRYLASLDLASKDVVLSQEECRVGLAAMRDFCSGGTEADVLHRANVTFHRLFVGPHHVPCPPWGSVYLDGGRLFGPSALEVAHELERHGFAIPEGTHEPSDHAAYELAFLGECLGNAATAWQRDDDVAAQAFEKDALSFLERYIEPWFSEFASKVREEDAGGLYEGLVVLTCGLLGFARTLLGDADKCAANNMMR